MKGLMNHCGASHVEIDDLRKLKDPKQRSSTHVPIRHDYFVDLAKGVLDAAGYKIDREEYALHRVFGKNKMTTDNLFGVLELTSSINSGMSRLVGIRNSSSMHFKAQFGCGNRVFVCDNLCFSAEIVVGRRHTLHILRDLPELMKDAVEGMNREFIKSEKRVDVYKGTPLPAYCVHDIAMLAMDAGAMPSSLLKTWMEVYRNPQHEEFRREDCWGLQNAFTEVAKRWNFPVMQERTQKLITVIDRAIDIDRRITDMEEEELATERERT